ncbi:MAG: Gfo/Idh/MocA family oxidoreductase [Bacteroidales bacterium]|jgi:UDP-2-acetamido-3-amino-2,3-dideoxy-glucuronate N-acetyltransferase|nr:Gfo/Idh/MocA family oxidoreductase [Bacteroidales bacterium]
MKRICVIGGGRWGKNHIRTLHQLGYLAAIAESNEAKLNEHLSAYPGTIGHTSVDEAIEAAYDGYTLATPAESHFDIALKIIRKGMNIMIEKPMTLTSEESEILVAEAKKSGSRLMVGHILLFHPAIRKIKEVIASGKIGKLFYIYSTRLNLGTVRTEESVFSSFAPHDISVLDYLVGAKATKIEAKGSKFLQDKVYDTTMTQFDYPDGVSAHIFVSWLHPFKEQLLVVVGSKGMISFDDSTKEKEIHFYNKRIDFENGIPVKVEEPDEIIGYEKKMPLEEELRYFVEHLDSTIEINTGENGLEVVRVLEAVENMIKNS